MHDAIDPRDDRDLRVLALREDGARKEKIARAVGVSIDVVETILVEDAREFPDEPLRRRA